MLITLASINTIIFVALSAIHFYWLAGGTWGLASSLPTNPSTQDFLFKPSIRATLIVAIGLLVFAIITLGNAGVISFRIEQRYFKWGNLVVSIIFLIRAVGDFKYVGFFKRIRETSFAKMDTQFYSPLCLTISTIGSLIFFLVSRSS